MDDQCRFRAKPVRIAAAVRRLLDEPGYGENARRIGRWIERDVAAERAVAELEAVGAISVAASM